MIPTTFHPTAFIRLMTLWLVVALGLGGGLAKADDTVCARVKIELKQTLTLERQGFEAQMTIANALDTVDLTDVEITVKVAEENGTPVLITSDTNDTSARFFIRLTDTQNIGDVSGNGRVNAKTTASATWLIIPAPGAAGTSPLGKKYLIGASLKYKFGGETQVIDVSPELITVKPMPLLILDYFLTQNVIGDDPLTPQVEATEPFTLGVRVKNSGIATAKNLKIDSAQPRIVDNQQGLPIAFRLTGSYLNDAPVANSLLMNFGDIAGNSAKVGRWIMESSLAGRFVDFSVRFSHADELGGTLTSLMQATNAHLLIRDVRVDLPGRDVFRDFLAKDGDVLRVYESDGLDSEVQDVSAAASLTGGGGSYRINLPATQGFVYAQLPDPNQGAMVLTTLTRADGKTMLPENLWLSKTQNPNTNQWEYWVNVFDVNTVGVYDIGFVPPSGPAQPPTLPAIPDRVVKEGVQLSFMVEATGQGGRPVTLSATPLPSGATFLAQPASPSAPGTSRALFDWTPLKGQAGLYLISYVATDGALSATRTATIKVEVDAPPPGPATPTIDQPASGAQVANLRPLLSVNTGADPADPTRQVDFEIYQDEAMASKVAWGSTARPAGTPGSVKLQFTPAADLQDNTWYWWRARAYDGGSVYSAWANGRLFVNLANDAPETFNLSTPTPGAEVREAQPLLTWTNSSDRDGDAITYRVDLYRDAALTDRITGAANLPPGAGGAAPGATAWAVDQPLVNHATYHWRAVARDSNGAETATVARSFVVDTGNTPPAAPSISSPADNGVVTAPAVSLVAQNSSDAENDALHYLFELDQVNTFDSGAKQASGPVSPGTGSTAWAVGGLTENRRYWWRVKATDGRAESGWTVANFLVNAVNEAPPTPTVANPGSGAWSSTLQPSLEANPVLDPDGDAVSYRFQVYRNSTLASLATEGVSASGAWIVGAPLTDKTTYWWRVRAEDAYGAASAWSAAAVLYVSTGPYQDPSIQLVSPASPVVPDASRKVTLSWLGVDPNIEPTVALYYGTTGSGYAGNLIVDGLRQPAGSQTGSYAWDVSALAPGAYYPYAAIYDAKGIGRAYAPGAVVIPTATQAGSIVAQPSLVLISATDNTVGNVQVRLGRAPTRDVVVPLSVSAARGPLVNPASLTFTPANWNVPQTVTLQAQSGCGTGLQTYSLLAGKAVSLDPDYIGVSAPSVSVWDISNLLLSPQTNIANLNVCHLSQMSAKKVNNRWEYTFQAELTNGTGAALNSVNATATLASSIYTSLFGIRVTEDSLAFGAVGVGETVKSVDTITIRSNVKLPVSGLPLIDLILKWKLTVR